MSSEKRTFEQVEAEPGVASPTSAAESTSATFTAATAAAMAVTSPLSDQVANQPIQSGRRSKKQKVQVEVPPVPNKPGQCHFYVKGKGRYCKLRAKLTNKYCGEHSMLEGNDGKEAVSEANSTQPTETAASDNTKEVRKRVPCPLDPTHTVWEDDLKSHTARCNARPRGSVAYVQDINLTLPEPTESILAQDMLTKLTSSELLDLVTKVEALYDKYVPPIRTMILDHPAMDERKKTIQNIKHAQQQGSLLGHMDRLGLLSDPRACFIEFGAGRGGLSRYLKEALQDRGEANFVLVDRMAVRNKADSYIAGIDQVPKSYVARRMIDIKDLKLVKLPETERSVGSVVDPVVMTQEKDGETVPATSEATIDKSSNEGARVSVKTKRPVVALSKHLCGGATDITLKCLVDYKAEFEASEQPQAVRGILIALCCHQLCRNHMYPNQKFLQECGITEREFALICRMSSWGVSINRSRAASPGGDSDNTEKKCEKDKSNDNDGEDEDEEEEHGQVDTAAKDLGSNLSLLNVQRRIELGLRCKRLLDIGRVKYLEKHGFDAEVIYYTDRDTSLENLALMAVPKQV
ncbi:tRNA:m(4)X modification enzyme TRM13 [Actinomortierella wolfii]|nr:tRNA:m(4)X modification enzyme TRM13 [Actinomortierella wolfii]